MRLNGNWLEATGTLPVPNNLGSPGMPNSNLHHQCGPRHLHVSHYPPLPAASQPVVVDGQRVRPGRCDQSDALLPA